MRTISLCFLAVTALIEIVPIRGFSNHFRPLLHNSRIGTTQIVCHLSSIDSSTYMAGKVIDDKNHIDYINSNALGGKDLIKKKYRKIGELKSRYEIVEVALLNYQKIYGDMLVPAIFIVPTNSDDFPSETWGMKLGNVVNKIRNNNAYGESKGKLMALGFDYSSQLRYTYDGIKTALVKYKEINSNMLVPFDFIVPINSDDFPKEIWEMKLGIVVSHIRNHDAYGENKGELTALGFDYKSQRYTYDEIDIALLKYKELCDNVLVPYSFIVPFDSPDFPEDVWEMKLGRVVDSIRQGSYSDKKEELLALGFVYVLRKKFDYENVKVAVFKYRELYHGSVKIPSSYKIPHNDPWYPEETWGMCLGSYVRRIKKGEKWPGKHSELFL